MTSSDLALAGIQRRQFGAFARRQAIEAGVAGSTVDARLAAGRYRALLRGVMSEAGAPDSPDQRRMAAQLWAGREAVLARWTAASVVGLDVPPGEQAVHLLVRTRCFDTPAGVRVHRTRRLEPGHTTEVGPLVTTTPARTVCDLAAELGPVALRRTLAHAARRGLIHPGLLRALLAELGRVRGKRPLSALLDELSPLEADCRSELESRFLRLMCDVELPPTAMNHPVVDARGQRRLIDAVYLPQRLPIELDSRAEHGTLIDWHDDLRRENAVTLTGGWLPFLRFSWHDVTQRPGAVVADVRDGLAMAVAHARDVE